MGKPNSFVSYGPQWAEAGSSPFRYFKSMVTEGGIVAPMIIAGFSVEPENVIHHGMVTVMDIAPTFYEAAGTGYPAYFKGRPVYPIKGKSMMGLISGKEKKLHDDGHIFALEHLQRAMLIQGPWKIVNNNPPFHPDSFQLYNLENDLSESNDLRDQEPSKYNELLEEWTLFSRKIDARFPIPDNTE
jgi:arylsulfatase